MLSDSLPIKLFNKQSLVNLLIFVVLILTSLLGANVYANEPKFNTMKQVAGLAYECHKKGKHIIHVLDINPKYFRLELVKAHNQVFGRETVSSIALRKGAFAAINAGFFEIGNSDDGRPSRTLIIDGQILSLVKDSQGLLIIDNNNLQIKQATAEVLLKIGNHRIIPNKVNDFPGKGDVVLYTSTWGPSSLTPYNFAEILIDPNYIVTKISSNGDNQIEPQGFILALPPHKNFSDIQKGDKVILEQDFLDPISRTPIFKNNTASVITGIPIIVKDGMVVDSLMSAKPTIHARTAIGTKPDGNIIMVVAEHFYTKPIQRVTLEEVQSILRKRQDIKMETITIPEVHTILTNHFTQGSDVVGFSLKELAEYMIELGCNSAINLDGGGSSTMFLDGNIVNATVGDEDEYIGQRVVRPVSDAIVLIPTK